MIIEKTTQPLVYHTQLNIFTETWKHTSLEETGQAEAQCEHPDWQKHGHLTSSITTRKCEDAMNTEERNCQELRNNKDIL